MTYFVTDHISKTERIYTNDTIQPIIKNLKSLSNYNNNNITELFKINHQTISTTPPDTFKNIKFDKTIYVISEFMYDNIFYVFKGIDNFGFKKLYITNFCHYIEEEDKGIFMTTEISENTLYDLLNNKIDLNTPYKNKNPLTDIIFTEYSPQDVNIIKPVFKQDYIDLYPTCIPDNNVKINDINNIKTKLYYTVDEYHNTEHNMTFDDLRFKAEYYLDIMIDEEEDEYYKNHVLKQKDLNDEETVIDILENVNMFVYKNYPPNNYKSITNRKNFKIHRGLVHPTCFTFEGESPNTANTSKYLSIKYIVDGITYFITFEIDYDDNSTLTTKLIRLLFKEVSYDFIITLESPFNTKKEMLNPIFNIEIYETIIENLDHYIKHELV
mgnify:CR=1 FL=1